MSEPDRLSALMSHFALHCRPCAPEAANLFLLCPPGAAQAERIVLVTDPDFECDDPDACETALAARVDWGGAANPMMTALPAKVVFDTRDAPDLQPLMDLICAELDGRRCGAETVLSRLCEILVVRLLRAEMQRGGAQTGMIAGLSDARLARALVAMHEEPGRTWTNARLADAAGLSLSRFAELFRQTVGMTPSVYLRQWRLDLASRDIRRGDRIDQVARRYGYGSSEALNHAFRRHLGHAPSALRQMPQDAARLAAE